MKIRLGFETAVCQIKSLVLNSPLSRLIIRFLVTQVFLMVMWLPREREANCTKLTKSYSFLTKHLLQLFDVTHKKQLRIISLTEGRLHI